MRGVCQETLFQLTLSQKLCSERCTRMIHRNPVSASLVFVPDSSLSPVQLYKMLCRHDLFNCELVPSLGSRELRKPQAPVHSRFTQSWVLGAVCCERARDSTVYGGWSTSAKHASKGANRQVVLYCTPHAAARSRGEGGRRDRGQGRLRATRRGSGRRSPR